MSDGESDPIPVPVVLIDQDSDPVSTIVQLSFGDRLGALIDTVNLHALLLCSCLKWYIGLSLLEPRAFEGCVVECLLLVCDGRCIFFWLHSIVLQYHSCSKLVVSLVILIFFIVLNNILMCSFFIDGHGSKILFFILSAPYFLTYIFFYFIKDLHSGSICNDIFFVRATFNL